MKKFLDKVTMSHVAMDAEIKILEFQLKDTMDLIKAFNGNHYTSYLWEQFTRLENLSVTVENLYYVSLGLLFEQQFNLKLIPDSELYDVDGLIESSERLNVLYTKLKLSILEADYIINCCRSITIGYKVNPNAIVSSQEAFHQAQSDFLKIKPFEERKRILIAKLNALNS